jgi:hypothetical protein
MTRGWRTFTRGQRQILLSMMAAASHLPAPPARPKNILARIWEGTLFALACLGLVALIWLVQQGVNP